MSIGLAFWIIILVWVLFGFVNYSTAPFGQYGIAGHGLFILALFCLLGWQVFGSALHK